MGAFSGRVRVSVPRMGVGEQAATTLALVVHELATNSLKYGALSSPTGTLDIACTPMTPRWWWSGPNAADRRSPPRRRRRIWQQDAQPRHDHAAWRLDLLRLERGGRYRDATYDPGSAHALGRAAACDPSLASLPAQAIRGKWWKGRRLPTAFLGTIGATRSCLSEAPASTG